MGRGDLNGVGGSSDGHHLDTGAEDEATDDELGELVGSRGNDGAEDNNPGSAEHTPPATVLVGNDGTDGGGNDGATVTD